MKADLKRLPPFFTQEDREKLQFLLNLNSEMTQSLEEWLMLLTNSNSLKKVKEASKGLQNIAKAETSRDEILEEVNNLNEKIKDHISVYCSIGASAAVKVLKEVTLEMIITMAEFNIISEKYDTYLGVNYVHKTN